MLHHGETYNPDEYRLHEGVNYQKGADPAVMRTLGDLAYKREKPFTRIWFGDTETGKVTGYLNGYVRAYKIYDKGLTFRWFVGIAAVATSRHLYRIDADQVLRLTVKRAGPEYDVRYEHPRFKVPEYRLDPESRTIFQVWEGEETRVKRLWNGEKEARRFIRKRTRL